MAKSIWQKQAEKDERLMKTALLQGIGMTAVEVLKQIAAHHTDQDTAYFEELRFGTGYRAQFAEQRIDAYAMRLLPMHDFARTAYEVKVSRSDWLAELKQPKKRRPALWVSNYFYFVAPCDVAKVEEVPPECGLIVVAPGVWHVQVAAPHRDTIPLPMQFVASLVRASLRSGAAG